MTRVLSILIAATIAAAPAPLFAQKIDEKVAKKAKAEPAKKPVAKKPTPTPKKKGVLAPAIEKQQKK